MNFIRNVILLLLFPLLSSCAKKELSPPTSPPITAFAKFKLLEDQINDTAIIIAGSADYQLVVAYKRNANRKYSATDLALPAVMKDDMGNVINVFGEVSSGPDFGERLEEVKFFTGYWLAISNFHSGIEIYNNTSTFNPTLPSNEDTTWSVPKQFVVAAAGKDGIPSLNNPNYIEPAEENENENSSLLSPNDLALILSMGEEKKIYPIPILNYHEIVNDQINGHHFALMYCPLTGTSNLWSSSNGMNIFNFGVSGLLYNNNLLPYDRTTESIWNQITGECIHGALKGTKIPYKSVIETTFGLARQIAPKAKILSLETGFDRAYQHFPYGDYRENHDLILYPNTVNDDRLPNKAKVLVVKVGEQVKAYPYKLF